MKIDREDELTGDIMLRIVDLLEAGVSIRGAMRAVKKSKATYYNWIARGKEGRSELHVKFMELTRQARGLVEREMVDKRITKARQGDNESIDKMLKQVNPEDYTDRVTVEAEVDKFLQKLEDNLSAEDYLKVLDAIEE